MESIIAAKEGSHCCLPLYTTHSVLHQQATRQHATRVIASGAMANANRMIAKPRKIVVPRGRWIQETVDEKHYEIVPDVDEALGIEV